MPHKPWYQSRKLWIAVATTLAVCGLAVGGTALGWSEALVGRLAEGLLVLGLVLITGHTVTDVATTSTLLQAGAEAWQQGKIRDFLERLAPLLPGWLEVTETAPARVPTPEQPDGEPRAPASPNVPEAVESTRS